MAVTSGRSRAGGHERSASYPDRVRAVTGEDVRSAAARCLHPERAIITVIGPIGRIADAAPMEGETPLERWATPPNTTQINRENRQ